MNHANDIVKSGIVRHQKDERDFKCGSFLGIFGGYTTKATRSNNVPFSIKTQFLDTCGWNSSGSQKEDDEKVPLSIKGFVKIGMRERLISGQGLSNLRDNQKVIQKFGIPEYGLIDESITTWAEYSDPSTLTLEALTNAMLHRSQSYAAVSSRDEVLRLLDQGRTLQTGMDWYREYNMGGGFSAPWKIDFIGNSLVGGHSIKILNYLDSGNTLQLLMSSGPRWGDGGTFYSPTDFFIRHWYGSFVQFDIPVNVASFLNVNQFAVIKDPHGPACYQIFGDVKCPYPDEATAILFLGENWKKEIIPIDSAIFAAIKTGPAIKPQDSADWGRITALTKPERLQEIAKHLITNT